MGVAHFVRGIAVGSAVTAAFTVDERSWQRLRSHPAYHTAANQGAKALRTFVDPERAHGLTIRLAKLGLAPVHDPARSLDATARASLKCNVWGKEFASPLGLAAGFDKQAEVIDPVLGMGFSFLEVGGVPPLPQPGNERPRMFRLPEDQAVINRFGLNSEGMDAVEARIIEFKARQAEAKGTSATATTSCMLGQGGIVGVNLAKNTSSTDATADFCEGVRRLGPICDFVVINVSCPNVAWTAQFKNSGGGLKDLIMAAKQERDRSAKGTPLLIKVGPDMSPEARNDMAKVILETGVDGVVVTNTSSLRPDSLQSEHAGEPGGLSGAPIKDAALETLRDMYRLTGGKVPLVGVGGIASAQDAYDRIRAGASLLELYTALVYQGPSLVGEINEGIAELLKRDGFATVAEAVGVDHKSS
jgi:dihydroorotate dehydrogenase